MWNAASRCGPARSPLLQVSTVAELEAAEFVFEDLSDTSAFLSALGIGRPFSPGA